MEAENRGSVTSDRNKEIAARLGYGLRTIVRKLQVIRTLWRDEAPP
jgi:hypothetical protein